MFLFFFVCFLKFWTLSKFKGQQKIKVKWKFFFDFCSENFILLFVFTLPFCSWICVCCVNCNLTSVRGFFVQNHASFGYKWLKKWQPQSLKKLLKTLKKLLTRLNRANPKALISNRDSIIALFSLLCFSKTFEVDLAQNHWINLVQNSVVCS